jgi:hypothetical protein
MQQRCGQKSADVDSIGTFGDRRPRRGLEKNLHGADAQQDGRHGRHRRGRVRQRVVKRRRDGRYVQQRKDRVVRVHERRDEHGDRQKDENGAQRAHRQAPEAADAVAARAAVAELGAEADEESANDDGEDGQLLGPHRAERLEAAEFADETTRDKHDQANIRHPCAKKVHQSNARPRTRLKKQSEAWRR